MPGIGARPSTADRPPASNHSFPSRKTGKTAIKTAYAVTSLTAEMVAYVYVVALAGMAGGEAERGKADCYDTYGDVPEQLDARGTHSMESPR
jgi:hypothetical protein